MIYGVLIGGLGNQLFIIATTLAHAKRCETEAVFSMRTNDTLRGITERKSYDDTILRFLNRQPFSRRMRIYKEPHFHYKKIPLVESGTDIMLNGYFQTPLYFQEYKDEINALFMKYYAETPTIREKVGEIIGINPKNTIAVHIRRGDYLKNPDIHHTQTSMYYVNGIDYIISNREFKEIPKIIFFCDDDGWCRSSDNKIADLMRKRGFEVAYGINAEKDDGDIIDFYAITNCANHVIANSSFSWWAAWLCPYDNIVVAPRKWFGKRCKHNWNDIYPKEWVIIN